MTGCRREALNRPEAGREAAAEQELCSGHRRRWILQGRPDMARFIATTKPKIVDYGQPRPCEVADCRIGRSGGFLCPQHQRAWIAAGEPPVRDWAAGVLVTEPQGPVCAVGRCPLVAVPAAGYCRAHRSRWIRLGRPDAEVFEAHLMNYDDSRWDFRRLPEQLKLEIQYAMQRADELGTAQRERWFGHMIRVLLHVGAGTLLEHTRGEWNDIFSRYLDHPRQHTTARAWLGFAVEQLTDLMEGEGWDHEYPRDVWELRRLGLRSNQRRMDFTDIAQPWLRELAKRWIHWRITVDEVSPVTATCDLKALSRMSGHLAATGQAPHSVAQLTRAALESHLAWLRTQPLAQPTIRDETSAIAVFLRALRDHEDWAPELPRTATIYPSDYPRIKPLRARGLSTDLMVQVREHLPRWRDPDGRFLTELMLGTGLRVGDACALGFDPLVFDADGHPYIHYWNHKMRCEAFVPIERALLAAIRDQQQRTAKRYPDQHAALLAAPAPRTLPHTGLRLVPRLHVDRTGHEPFRSGTYQQQLRVWQRECNITDEAGRPVALTAHQWRHTYATSLINKGVRIEVIKQLLDHASLDMASHYARLLDTTIRAEWEAGHGADQLPAGAGLAEAAWNNRARTALPNGHCGLPRQQSCDHSNKCLTCPVFITTSADLPAHEEHRRRTLTLITQLEERGQTRLADQNRAVLDHLDARIAEVRHNPAHASAAEDSRSDAG